MGNLGRLRVQYAHFYIYQNDSVFSIVNSRNGLLMVKATRIGNAMRLAAEMVKGGL